MRIAVFPGSFNPFTVGHADIVSRGLGLFDRIVVAVGCNVAKGGATGAEAEARVADIQRIYAQEPRVKVVAYDDLTTALAAREGARFLLRGVRSVRDFDYERDIAAVNRDIADLETVFLLSDPRFAHISSSVVRELQSFGHDVSPYLP